MIIWAKYNIGNWFDYDCTKSMDHTLISSLLTTKFHIPQTSANIVLRPRLFEMLNDGGTRKLALLSAPAGFGKSTLISEWSRSKKIYFLVVFG